MANAHIIGPFFRTYGVILSSGGLNSNIQVMLEDGIGAAYTGTLAAGDVKISKDGGVEANIATLPTQVGVTGVWVVTLSAAEMQAAAITVRVSKAGVALTLIIVETNLALGRIKVDASQIGGNNAALHLVGVGTGAGLRAVSGVSDLAYGIHAEAGSGASAGMFCDASGSTNVAGATGLSALGGNGGGGFGAAGNGAGPGIRGTGGATGSGIEGKAGSSAGAAAAGILATGQSNASGMLANKAGTGVVCNFFDAVEGSEPTVAPANNASIKEILQFLKRRLCNKVEATAGVLTVYRDDSATGLYTQARSSTGTTMTIGKAA